MLTVRTRKEMKVDMKIKSKTKRKINVEEPGDYLPLVGATDDIPHLRNWKLCPTCGLPAPIWRCDVRECNQILGYSMQRLRVITRCTKCKGEFIYRLAWMEIQNGEFVKVREAGL